jgi:tRNA(Ile)-lysidine synthase
VKRRRSLVAAVGRCLGQEARAAGVVAVSGGPDSLALLRALLTLRGDAQTPLIIAHLNHALRGAESDADEAFVRQVHAGLLAAGAGRLELRCDRIDVASRARQEGANLEATARRLRYDWLGQVAAEAGAGWVATGHTADDQAETVLHRLLRGAGLRGLRGIAVRRPLRPGVELVRPLLGVTRADVLAYLEEQGQPYREDRSNADLAFTRNRIRHELLPLLAGRYNPAVARVLGRLAEQAAELYRQEEAAARALLVEAERPRAGNVLVFDRAWLAAAPRHRAREALRLAWEREGWPAGGMGYEQWDRLAGLARGEATALDLPGGIRARARGRVVQLGPIS